MWLIILRRIEPATKHLLPIFKALLLIVTLCPNKTKNFYNLWQSKATASSASFNDRLWLRRLLCSLLSKMLRSLSSPAKIYLDITAAYLVSVVVKGSWRDGKVRGSWVEVESTFWISHAWTNSFLLFDSVSGMRLVAARVVVFEFLLNKSGGSGA